MPNQTLYSINISSSSQASTMAKAYVQGGKYLVGMWQLLLQRGEEVQPLNMVESIQFVRNEHLNADPPVTFIVDITESGPTILNELLRYNIKPKAVTLNETLTADEAAIGALAIRPSELLATVQILSQANRLNLIDSRQWADAYTSELQQLLTLAPQSDQALSTLEFYPRMKALAIACWYGEYLDRQEQLVAGTS